MGMVSEAVKPHVEGVMKEMTRATRHINITEMIRIIPYQGTMYIHDRFTVL